jgi:(R)-amidase
LKVILAQISIVDAETASNLARVLSVIESVGRGADLVVFPETTLSGFPKADEASEIGLTLESAPIMQIGRAARRMRTAVAFGFVELVAGTLYNTALLLDKTGSIRLRYRKTHLWPYTDVGIFAPGNSFFACDIDGLRIGLLICYDVEFPETSRALAQMNVDLIVVLDGNMAPYGPVHRRAVVMRAIENQCFAVLVNRVGSSALWEFQGDSLAVSPLGEIIAELGQAEETFAVEVSRSRVFEARKSYDYRRDLRIGADLREVAPSEDNYRADELRMQQKTS